MPRYPLPPELLAQHHDARAIDGDSLALTVAGAETRLRLWGIDAPEHGQPWADQATKALRDLVAGHEWRITRRGVDRYGRHLVTMASNECHDLATALVLAGHAWHYEPLAPAARHLANAQRAAQRARIGLWSIAPAIEPWLWRRASKRAAALAAAPPAPRARARLNPDTVLTDQRAGLYHRVTCAGRPRTSIYATLRAAAARGLKPCAACFDG